MTGYLKALCSILGTLLALALIASPGAAQKKKKKAAEDAPAAGAEAEASGSGSIDSLMESATEKKEDKKKKGKKAEEEAAPAEEEKPAEEEVAEPDAWERPPMEEKAPPKEAVAPAPEPSNETPFSAALLLGYGFKTDRSTGGAGADPYGFMAGLRGGYTFDFNLYAGVYFNYYLGSSKKAGSARVNLAETETSASYMQFGLEAGYDVNAGPVLFRPSLEIGMAIGFSDAGGETASVSDIMFAPGATLVYPIDDFFIGGDLRANIVTGDGVSGVTLAATGGLRF